MLFRSNNPFRRLIANLRGQDPANPNADYVDTLEHYAQVHRTSRFNSVFILGGLNYGTQDYIGQQLEIIVTYLLFKRDAKIYWRFYTEPDPSDPEADTFFYWTPTLIQTFADQFNFEIVELMDDADNSLYSYWYSYNRAQW